MRDEECVALLQWALPQRGFRWQGFRRVRRQVCKRLSRRIGELGLADAAAYRARLEADPAEWVAFDACCRVSISRFYRDRGVFEAVTRDLLPELARVALAGDRPVLRAWSAGCASGEEPYGLRIAWSLAVRPALARGELWIVATDASPELLERARRAVYPASALADLPPAWRAAAFDERDGSYRLRDAFRAGVELRREDIREAMPAGRFDLILCRNLVFTYFERELQRALLGRLVERLEPSGALLLGAHEALPEAPEAAGLTPTAGTPGLYRVQPGSVRCGPVGAPRHRACHS